MYEIPQRKYKDLNSYLRACRLTNPEIPLKKELTAEQL